jgi:crotonobetainyl-CoA:carnitine CoA-transferase CaiB-like acyl-CoA transferase
MTRFWKLPSENKSVPFSAYYCSVNYKKKVVFLDLNELKDKEILYQLIAESDIIIANYKNDSAKKMGVDYDTVKKIKHDIIYAHLAGFPNHSERVAYDLVLQAEAGFMFMNGQPDSPPTKMPLALIDVLAAHQLKEGILCALIKKIKTGEGSLVTTSLYESAIASLINQATNWLMGNHIPKREGSLHPNIAPYGEIFTAKDGVAFTLAIGTDKQFKILCEQIENVELAVNEKFSSNQNRIANRTELFHKLNQSTLLFDWSELSSRFLKNDIPFGKINDLKDVFSKEFAQNMILTENIDHTTTKRVKTVAFQLK